MPAQAASAACSPIQSIQPLRAGVTRLAASGQSSPIAVRSKSPIRKLGSFKGSRRPSVAGSFKSNSAAEASRGEVEGAAGDRVAYDRWTQQDQGQDVAPRRGNDSHANYSQRLFGIAGGGGFDVFRNRVPRKPGDKGSSTDERQGGNSSPDTSLLPANMPPWWSLNVADKQNGFERSESASPVQQAHAAAAAIAVYGKEDKPHGDPDREEHVSSPAEKYSSGEPSKQGGMGTKSAKLVASAKRDSTADAPRAQGGRGAANRASQVSFVDAHKKAGGTIVLPRQKPGRLVRPLF
jgi:hypothetical protein